MVLQNKKFMETSDQGANKFWEEQKLKNGNINEGKLKILLQNYVIDAQSCL